MLKQVHTREEYNDETDCHGKPANFEGDPDTPILWVLRDHLDVTSPKFGCGMALCGACTRTS